jgi:polyisoprenyl-teichoic acid--peptidoglycan teichoic acid transferase
VLVLLGAIFGGGLYLWANSLVVRTHTTDPSVAVALTTPAPTGGTVPTTEPPRPGAQNILLMGSDLRPDTGEKYGRSDTLMLVHIDPGGNYVSVLSLPRDLRVDLGSHGYQKINAAYAFGGPTLAITTVLALTGLKVKHFVNIGFEAFSSVTTALGGIYVDVDRRYYSTVYGYEPIDMQPGYQRIAGDQALTFVRWRHDLNTDYGRIDRQQLFLRAAKEQAMQWSMATKIPSVVSLLTRHVTSDLSTVDAIRLSWWGVKLSMGRVKQVKLATTDGYIDGTAWVFATPKAMQTAVNELLQPPSNTVSSVTSTSSTTPATTGTASTSTTSGVTSGAANLGTHTFDLRNVSVELYNASGRPAAAAAAVRVLQRLGAHILKTGAAPRIGTSVVFAPAWSATDVMNDPPDAAMVGQALGVFKQVEDNTRRHIQVYLGADYAVPSANASSPTFAAAQTAQWRWLAGKTSFPLQAPVYLPPDYTFAGTRIYDIKTDQGAKPALKVMYRFGREDQFFGLMETTFVDAPAASPGEQWRRGDTVYTIVETGPGVDHIWWEKDGTLYWVSNTLADLLTKDEMLSVATSMTAVQ